MSKADVLKLTPEIISAVLQFVVLIVLPVVGKAYLDAQKRALLVASANAVYLLVEQIAAKTPGTVDDKLALGLKRLAETLGRELDAKEERLAKLTFAAAARADKVGMLRTIG